MEGISDIQIVGIDEKRPPKIRKEPYIDLFFKLSHQAPPEWCYIFNSMLTKHPSTPRIKEQEGLYIETWVRSSDKIVALLTQLKDKVTECSGLYIEQIEASIRQASDANTALSQEEGEQGRLNRIVAELDFGLNKTS